MGVTSQSRSSHHINMKVFVALAGLVAVTSAYPMFLLEDGAEVAYEPVYRMARQAPVLMPHMAPRLLVALRSRPTEAPARARDMRCLPPGDITTPSHSTLENTTK